MIDKIQAKINKVPMDEIVEWVSAIALELKATDIHFEAEEKKFHEHVFIACREFSRTKTSVNLYLGILRLVLR